MRTATDYSKYPLGMRNDLSGCAEYMELRKASLRVVLKLIYKVSIAHFGCSLLIVNNGVLGNQALTRELLERYNIWNVQVEAYHLP